MTTDNVLDMVIREYAGFYLEDADEEKSDPTYQNHCEFARVFHHWGLELLAEYVQTNPTPVRLAQAKVLLLDQYFDWRATVSPSHRNRIGEHGHVCLHHILERIFLQIRLAHLRIVPVQVFNPSPPPPPAPQPAPLGITLGEVLGEE